MPLQAVLTQMKCEIARALVEVDRDRVDLSGWLIDGKLTARIITHDEKGGSISTPSMVPIGAGVTAGFKLAGSVVQSRTSVQIADFVVSSQASSREICDRAPAPGIRRVDNLGIYDWIKALSLTVAGEPVMGFTALDYDLTFGVKRGGEFGADVKVVPIQASAKVAATRDDIQQLTLSFDPPKEVVAVVKKQVANDGRPGRAQVPGMPGGVIIFSPDFGADGDAPAAQ